MRLFLAIDLPVEIKAKASEVVRDLASALRSEKVEIKWVRPEQFHFTLKFLGECPEEQVPVLAQALEAAFTEIEPFSVRTGEVGAYPDKGPLRVIWLGLQEGEAPMADLARRTDGALE